MVSIQELAAGIQADASAQVQQIEQQAHGELARYAAETEMLLGKERERMYAIANRQRDEFVARMQAKRQLEAMQLTLKKKQELLDEVFAAAKSELSKPSVKTSLLTKFWQQATKQIVVASVIVANRDADFFKGKKVQVIIQDCLGGFIAQSADGRVRVDCRFETLLDDVRSRKTAEITAVLFQTDAKVRK